MKDRAKKFFVLGEQYLETSILLLDTLIENNNVNFWLCSNEKELDESLDKDIIKSDFTIFIPAIFNAYQSIELLLKAILLLNNQEISNTHNSEDLLVKFKIIYNENSEIYEKISNFYNIQIEIIEKFKKTNGITTTTELYESLRYPEDTNRVVEKKKFYNYIDLVNNGKLGIEKFKDLRNNIKDIKTIILKEYHKIEINDNSKIRKNVRYTKLTEKDYNLFYKSIFYGNIDNPIDVAVKLAYKDLCRTITGFSKNEKHDIILNNATKMLYKEIISLLSKNTLNQKDFDSWHKKCSDKLIKIFENQKFYYGQAQKWINMSLKYLSIFKHKLVEKQYEFFHIPIDNYIINITGKRTSVAWSRISNYDEYIDYQNEFRNTYEGIPLDKEFELWLNAKKKK